MEIPLEKIKQLRDMTGLSMLECKKALEESDADIEKAIEYLKRQGKSVAHKKSIRTASEGLVGSYVHTNGKIGVLVELRCETDFVARSEEFKKLSHDIAMHIAAADPRYLSPGDIPEEEAAKERRILAEAFAGSGKPPEIIAKIVEGKLATLAKELCLLEQPFVKEPDKTVKDLIQGYIARFGENIAVGNFIRFQI